MAEPFLRVDLSNKAVEFQTQAVEPGLPLVDRSMGNAKLLFRWLDGYVAEPQWQGDTLSYYVRHAGGGRPEKVRCVPATDADLNGPLKKDVDAVRGKLGQIKPETATERVVLQILKATFDRIAAAESKRDVGCFLFKYTDVQNQPHLVWCWGYRRKQQDLAHPLVCPKPGCHQLLLERQGKKTICPVCQAAPPPQPKTPEEPVPTGGTGKKWLLLVLLLLLLGGAGGGYWWWQQRQQQIVEPPPQPQPTETKLVVTPETWEGIVGAELKYELKLVGPDAGESGEQLLATGFLAIADDPRVMSIDAAAGLGRAKTPGQTRVEFHHGQYSTQCTVQVLAPPPPTKLRIEPEAPQVARGATVQLKAWGEYEGQEQPVDLTDVVLWKSAEPGTVFVYRGHVEGLKPGTTQVQVEFAFPEGADKSLTANVEVTVVEATFESLEIKVPSPLAVGQSGPIEVFGIASGNRRYALTGSSMLSLSVDPEMVARIDEGQALQGQQVGKAKITATYQQQGAPLTASTDFEVVAGGAADAPPLLVRPKQLQLAVGELTELQVVAQGAGDIQIESANPQIAEVAESRQVIGRSPGSTELTVVQGEHKVVVPVAVERIPLESIAIVPDMIVLAVNDSVKLRVVGRTAARPEFTLAPDQVVWERQPASKVAEFQIAQSTLRGLRPTGESPETMVVRFEELTASATLEIVDAPARLELAPAEPGPLPAGQSLVLEVFGHYGDGRRVQIPGEEVEWIVAPEDATGLTFDAGRVTALAADGQLKVQAKLRDQTSNEVVIRTGAAESLRLQADVRQLYVVGEDGALVVTAEGPNGPVELPPGTLEFSSSQPEVLEIDPQTGAFRAAAAGSAEVSVKHAQAGAPLVVPIEVVERDEVRLVFRPERLLLAVDEQAQPQLVLETIAADDPREAIIPTDHPKIRYGLDEGDYVSWAAPLLVALKPTDRPVELTARFVRKTATLAIEVNDGQPADGQPQPSLRVLPEQAAVALGQWQPLIVQRRAPGSDEWRDVRPDRVKWTVPPGLLWRAPTSELPPQVSIPPDASGDYTITGEYRGQQVAVAVRIVPLSELPDLSLASVEVVLVREPPGELLAVGREQRYSILVRDGDRLVPAADVEWTPPLESEFVVWDPPVLRGVQAGHTQMLEARVGDRRIRFHTTIVTDLPPESGLDERDDAPESIRWVVGESAANGPITLAVGTDYSNFRIEAVYPDGAVRDVTREALIVLPADVEEPPVAVSGGRLRGRRAGETNLVARYHNVDSPPQAVTVLAEIEIDEIRLQPTGVTLAPGESFDVEAVGYYQGQPVGSISHRRELEWKSRTPEVLSVAGPIVTGIAEGTGGLTAQWGDIVSHPLEVTVTGERAAQQAQVQPSRIVLRPGESAALGVDLRLYVGGIDRSDVCDVAIADPELLRFDPTTRSLVALSPGQTRVRLSAGGAQAIASVEIVPDEGGPPEGQLVLEPSAGTLFVGQGGPLRLYLVTPDGQRQDRTAGAVWESSNPGIVRVSGGRILAIAVGSATISATLPGIDGAATARFAVVDGEYTALEIVPGELQLQVGQEQRVRMFGVGPRGRREISGHESLLLALDDPQPTCAELRGLSVRGLEPGTATLQVAWGDLRAAAPISVASASNETELLLTPEFATVGVGETVAFRVTARRGSQTRDLTNDRRVQWAVEDPALAELLTGGRARGLRPGRTQVAVRMGRLRAVATLVIAAGAAPPAPESPVVAIRFVDSTLPLVVGGRGAVRVVQVHADGHETDVSDAVQVSLTDPSEAVQLSRSARGVVARGQAPGQALLTASLGDLTTADPLLVDVTSAEPERARLNILPDPVVLNVGDVLPIERVELYMDDGRSAGSVPVTVASGDQDVAAVEGGSSLRGVAPGQTSLTIRVADPGSPFDGLETTIGVQVLPRPTSLPPESEPSSSARLVLSGPTEAAVGEEVPYQVELVDGAESSVVTHDGASLVLAVGDESLARLEPGCVVIPTGPGVVTLQARRGNLLSNELTLRIGGAVAPSADWATVRLDMDRGPLEVGASRRYRIRARPQGSQEWIDVTGQMAAGPNDDGRPWLDARTPEGDAVDGLVAIAPREIAALASGVVVLQAHLGNLESSSVELDLVARQSAPHGLRIEPGEFAVHVGEQTPRFRAIESAPGEPEQPVSANWTSLDENILRPVAGQPGVFEALSPGTTQIQAEVNGVTALASVEVRGNRFLSVQGGKPQRQGDTFTVPISVTTEATNPPLEFRVVARGGPAVDEWTPATVQGGQAEVNVLSPPLPFDYSRTFQLVIEARDPQTGALDRYPYSFRLTFDIDPNEAGE